MTTNTTPLSQLQLPSDTRIGLVWAQSLDGVIGLDGDMPWHVPEDLKHFKEVTMGQVLVMGRKTWLSFPPAFRPLPGRTSIIVSKTLAENLSDPDLDHDDVHVAADLEQGLQLAGELKTGPMIWVIGGGSLYDQTLKVATVVERSLFNIHVDGDTYAPKLDTSWSLTQQDPPDDWHTSKSSVQYRFERWERTLD